MQAAIALWKDLVVFQGTASIREDPRQAWQDEAVRVHAQRWKLPSKQ